MAARRGGSKRRPSRLERCGNNPPDAAARGRVGASRIGTTARRVPPDLRGEPMTRRHPAAAATTDRADAIDQNDRRSNSINGAQRQPLGDMRLQRNVVRPSELEPRAVYEFLAELGCDFAIRDHISERAERYATRLDPAILVIIGRARMPPAPIWLVRRAGP
jgi:hypothetical protein